MRPLQDERGQAIVITVVFLTVLVGLAAAVLDVGAWYRLHRQLQTTADASALAGAQALPDSPADGVALALEYGSKNGGGVSSSGISITGGNTISVKAAQTAPGIFASLFGLDSVDVAARAKARTGVPGEARWVAPIVVDERHPLLQCDPLPCFGDDTEIPLHHLHRPGGGDAAGSFGLINLDNASTGTPGSDTVGRWISEGFDAYMPLGLYHAVPSTMFNSVHIRGGLNDRVGDEILLPIYRTILGPGAEAEYDVIGWVGFHLFNFDARGSSGKLHGWFTRVVWEGIVGESSEGEDFGVRSIELIE